MKKNKKNHLIITAAAFGLFVIFGAAIYGADLAFKLVGFFFTALFLLSLARTVKNFRQWQEVRPQTLFITALTAPLGLLIYLMLLQVGVADSFLPLFAVGLAFGLVWGLATRVGSGAGLVYSQGTVWGFMIWGILVAMLQLSNLLFNINLEPLVLILALQTGVTAAYSITLGLRTRRVAAKQLGKVVVFIAALVSSSMVMVSVGTAQAENYLEGLWRFYETVEAGYFTNQWDYSIRGSGTRAVMPDGYESIPCENESDDPVYIRACYEKNMQERIASDSEAWLKWIYLQAGTSQYDRGPTFYYDVYIEPPLIRFTKAREHGDGGSAIKLTVTEYEGMLNEDYSEASGTFSTVRYYGPPFRDQKIPMEVETGSWVAYPDQAISSESPPATTPVITDPSLAGDDHSKPGRQAAAAIGTAAAVSLASLLMNIAQKPIPGKDLPAYTSGDHPVNAHGQVFYQPPWEQSGAYWMDGDEYRRTREMLSQGKVWSNEYGWQDSGDLALYRGQVQQQRDYQQELYQKSLREQEEHRQRRQKEAERLEDYLAGREGVDISDIELDEGLRSSFEALRSENREFQATRKASIKERMEESEADAAYYSKVAHRWDMAAKGAELVKNAADTTIDVMAKVTGPKGRQIRRAYRAISNFAGGLSEGYATGEYSRSMIEATARILDGEIGDRLGGKTKRVARFRVYHKVGGDMIRGGYEGYQNMGKGETLLGALALGALEGGAKGASSLLKGSLEGADKVVYSAYEEMFRVGYNSYKGGGNLQTVQSDMAYAGVGSVVDSGADNIIEHLLSRPKATSVDDMLKHIQKIAREVPDDMEAKKLIAALTGDQVTESLDAAAINAIYDSFIEMGKGTVKGEGLINYYQNTLKLL